jgi:hypothetical protein
VLHFPLRPSLGHRLVESTLTTTGSCRPCCQSVAEGGAALIVCGSSKSCGSWYALPWMQIAIQTSAAAKGNGVVDASQQPPTG